MIDPVVGSMLGAAAAAIVGVFVYVATRKRDKVDDRSKLFDDALQLATAHKESWEKATAEIEVLRQEIAKLRDEINELRTAVRLGIREGEMWRGVAVEAYTAYFTETGKSPLWWPKGQPCPEVA